MHGKKLCGTFVFDWFSKDVSTVIGSLSPRTKVYCCTNISYRISRKQVKKCVMTILYGVPKLYRILIKIAKTNVPIRKRKQTCAPVCTSICVGVRVENVKV